MSSTICPYQKWNSCLHTVKRWNYSANKKHQQRRNANQIKSVSPQHVCFCFLPNPQVEWCLPFHKANHLQAVPKSSSKYCLHKLSPWQLHLVHTNTAQEMNLKPGQKKWWAGVVFTIKYNSAQSVREVVVSIVRHLQVHLICDCSLLYSWKFDTIKKGRV